MHFSIPETEVRSDENGSTYVAYNIHVNGVLHCRVRYSQLLGLHEQIKKEYGNNVVPAFPPKKIFTLTPAEVDQRREQLEKYMQAVRQDPILGSSEMFNSFLRKAQQETQQIPTEEVQLEIYLSNGQKVKVNILTSDQTEDVLEAVASKLDLPDELVGYFSLFLVQEREDGGCTYVRKLQEFELPYVSITSLHSTDYRIVLRKSYWDTAYDNDVMDDRVGLNLLYAQTVSDIERGWILVNKEQHRQLKSLQEKGSKKEFIRLAQTLKYYGYIKFDPCITDFPEKGCHVIVGAGNNELNFHVKLPSDQMKEGSFKVTRMRCWRVTSSQVPVANGTANPSSSSKCDVKLELAFEYLMSKDRLQWVTITSPQAIMMSICLQSMVDELMVKKSGGSIKKMQKKRLNGSFQRSDSQQAVKSPPLLDSPDPSREQVVKLSTKLSSVSLRGLSSSNSASDISGNDFHGNYAFEGIGDDDL
ncbi:sorting nexin-17 isoform X2 [Onychostoma macrolepis]|uniref:sorting nexin-17 isoform X2 n=1 Tax=Onychostoma macrolepis TaxID=369639 RepID=UPI002729B135|nr:sorting nexin-17 isoform X2 [Onychostoma macrolepis]